MAGHAPEIAVPKFAKAKVAIISSSWHLDICNDLIDIIEIENISSLGIHLLSRDL